MNRHLQLQALGYIEVFLKWVQPKIQVIGYYPWEKQVAWGTIPRKPPYLLQDYSDDSRPKSCTIWIIPGIRIDEN